MKRNITSILFFGLIISTAFSQKHLDLTSCKYNPELKTTKFSYISDYSFVIDIPGNWTFLKQNNSSKDFVFSDSLKHQLYIFVGGKGKDTFNKTNLNDSSFVKAFYKWDVDWILASDSNSKSEIVENEIGRYILCKINSSKKTLTSLYGLKKSYGVRFTLISDISDKEREDFIKALYENLK